MYGEVKGQRGTNTCWETRTEECSSELHARILGISAYPVEYGYDGAQNPDEA